MKKIIVLICIFISAGALFSLNYIVQVESTVNELDSSDSVVTSTMYYTDRFVRMEQDTGIVLIADIAEEVIILLYPQYKGYQRVTFDDMRKYFDSMASIFADLELFTDKSDETDVINGWQTSKYSFKVHNPVMTIISEQWVATDIVVQKTDSLLAFEELFAGMLSEFYEAASDEFKNLDGLAVKQISKMEIMGRQIITEKEILEAGIVEDDSTLFEIPEGYTLIEE